MKTCIRSKSVERGRTRNRIALRADKEPAETTEEFRLPSDLSAWVEPCRLMEWVEEEVAKLDWSEPQVVEYLRQHPAYRPRTMLGVLGYGYATQVFGSEEIAQKCRMDTVFRLLCDGQPPNADELRAFRRENRGLLRGILAYVFIRAVREKFGLGQALFPPGLKRYLLNNAVERLDLARHIDTPTE